MSKVVFDITMSLDGFIAGPNDSVGNPLGDGGERLHQWVYGLDSWRERQGEDGSERNRDAEIVEEAFRNVGATIMGRRMFSNGEGPWGDVPFEGHWGANPPYHVPVFVLTHHARVPLPMDGGTTFTFVTGGIESALQQAKAAAGDKDVSLAGGAEIIRQYLRAGLVDELQMHIAPVLLGGGNRLFDHIDSGHIELESIRTIESSSVTHLKYRVVKEE